MEKPRRPKPESLEYLSGVQHLFAEGAIEDELERDAALSNVVSELRWEAASLAADKAGSELLEALARAAPARAQLRLLAWCAPYGAFLALHRHSSHVLQTLLSLVAARAREHGYGSPAAAAADDDDEAVPSSASRPPLASRTIGARNASYSA